MAGSSAPSSPRRAPNKEWHQPRDATDGKANPVVESAEYALQETNLAQINDAGIKAAAQYINSRMNAEEYTPRTWRTHPLHIVPPEATDPQFPKNRQLVLNWIFLISSLNFSFWSTWGNSPSRYGVQWREGWNLLNEVVHTGYWSLVAAIDRAMDEGYPITDPEFYASKSRCSDELIAYIFRRASVSEEDIPLLRERINILRENGAIICDTFGGSFGGFMDAFDKRFNGQGSALQLVKMVAETFPSFRDEVVYNGRKVYIWKRAQILVAEMWAAFYPEHPQDLHPLFPRKDGPAIHELTMFADYRVPQILHYLRMISYPAELCQLLEQQNLITHGSREEVSIRAASIIAVERVREEIRQLRARENSAVDEEEVTSVLIDFYLWDLAKDIEAGVTSIAGLETSEIVPAHRTRSIWY